MPAGAETTVPVPLPAGATVTSAVRTKLTPAFVGEVIDRLQLVPLVPAHADTQPANLDVASGAAVNVTCVPLSNWPLQSSVQLMPDGADVTVPPPVPLKPTERPSAALKPAPTWIGPLTMNEQLAVPLHAAPSHPVNRELADGVAVSVTRVPSAICALHSGAQPMPPTSLVICPDPVPLATTVTVWNAVQEAVSSGA